MKLKITYLLLLAVSFLSLPLAGQKKTLNIPDIPGYITLKCDFHIHTVFSDGRVWPTIRVYEAYRDGLDAIAITDHIEYQPHKDYLQGDLNTSWEIAKKAASDMNILLIHGAEITRKMPPGHINALFIQDAEELKDPDFMKDIEAAVKQGAFIQYNHPGWKSQEPDGIPKLYPLHKELIAKGWLHGIEYFNHFEYYPEVLDMCMEYNLAVMGNCDAHDAISDTYNGMAIIKSRPVTLVFAKERSIESIREALFAGRTAVWYEDQIAGFSEYTAPLFYNSIETGKPFKSDEKNIWFEITNKSDIPFQLINGPDGAPKQLTIPAAASVVVKAQKRYADEPLGYEVKNIITGNGKILKAEIRVPKE